MSQNYQQLLQHYIYCSKSVTLILAMTILTGLVSCENSTKWVITPVAPVLAPDNPFAQNLKLLGSQTVFELQILHSFTDEPEFGRILSVSENIETGLLTVIYSDGVVRIWDVLEEKIVHAMDIQFLDPQGDFLDERNQIVLSANEYIPNDELMFPGKASFLVNGVSIYDLRTGKLIECWGFNCPDSILSQMEFGEVGVSLSPDGIWLASFVTSQISISRIKPTNSTSIGSIMNLEEDLSRRHISQLTFGPAGDMLAIANEEGGIEIYPFDKKTGAFSISNTVVIESFGTLGERGQPVEHLVVDETQAWIAKAQASELTIWSLTNPHGSPVLTLDINLPSTIAFDRLGQLLFVGFGNFFGAYSLENGSLIYSTAIPEISTIYVSRDNKLLVLGNALGEMYLFGIPGSK